MQKDQAALLRAIEIEKRFDRALASLMNPAPVTAKGTNAKSKKPLYVSAIGLVLVLTLIVWEIILYLQKIVHSGRERGLLFIYAALLFEYGTYIIIIFSTITSNIFLPR